MNKKIVQAGQLERLTECLLSLGSDSQANINRLVALCGQEMGAVCALYNRLDEEMICSIGQWHPPVGFCATDKADGHICNDVIRQNDDKPLVIRNLLQTSYARTDPNVAAYGLKTYIGVSVKIRGEAAGSLCVVFVHDLDPSSELLDFMRLVGYALSAEEERRLEQASLRASEAKFRNVFEKAQEGIFQTSVDGRYISVNPALAEMYGFASPEELMNSRTDISTETYCDPQERKNFLKMMQENGFVKGYEYEVWRKDGSKIWLYEDAQAIKDDLGDIKYFEGFVVDISHRKRAEQALALSQFRLRLFIDANADLLFLKDVDLKYQMVNRAYAAFFGKKYTDILGKTDEELMPPPAARSCRESDQLAMQEMRTLVSVEPIGETVYEAHKFPVILKGQVVGVAGMIRDITKRRQDEERKLNLEAQSRQIQKAESLARMAGSIAHHFNNQLGAVMGNLELAMKGLPETGSEYSRLHEAMLSARKAAQVSTQMLTYLGQGTGQNETLDLADTCQQCLPMIEAAIPKDVALETELPDPGPLVCANARQLEQLLENLLTNAWEAIADGHGRVFLTVKTATAADIPTRQRFPSDWQPNDVAYACLQVRDSGSGVLAQDIDKLFDPFFSTKFAGRGLGLSVVLGIVKTYSGAICVDSEPGQSTFTVYLPLTAKEIAPPPAKEPVATKITRGSTVLLVEDEELVRNMAAALLEHLGFAVIQARDGVEALELFGRHRSEIRVVLCDLSMPRLNGWETLAALRALRPALPVVLASGYDETQVMADDHPEKPQAFLHKPYMLAELKWALERAMEENDE